MKKLEKNELLNIFRNSAEKYYSKLDHSKNFGLHKQNSSKMNTFMNSFRDRFIQNEIGMFASSEVNLLHNILLVNYVSYIVMLEYRNKCWEYDYMAFSRRIGEIWEPFCKLPFRYPIKTLQEYPPMNFTDVQSSLIESMKDLVTSLDLNETLTNDLLTRYNSVWNYVDSGAINLNLDLHFIQDGVYYDVDYKSGFSSNEKGNTNRLLLVASVYRQLSENHNTLMFVRQEESQNNHYLQTLKHSGLWEVYCAKEAYNIIYHFTGFNLGDWMESYMDWSGDISSDFREFLINNDLIKYLTW